MTDYSKLSDEDINSMVIIELIKAGKLTDDHEDISGKPYTSDGWNWGPGVKTNLFKDGKPFVTHHNGRRLDYCNNPADAWPIIVGSKIKIEPMSRVRNYNEWYEEWDASVNSPHLCESHKNPLRAAMIVFLLMQEK